MSSLSDLLEKSYNENKTIVFGFLLCVYLLGALYVINGIINLFILRRSKEKSPLLRKLIILNLLILLTFIVRMVLFVLRLVLTKKGTLWNLVYNLLGSSPVMFKVLVGAYLAYLFYFITTDLTCYAHEFRKRMAFARKLLFSFGSIAIFLMILGSVLCWFLYPYHSNMTEYKRSMYIWSRLISSAITFICWLLLVVAKRRFVKSVEEICQLSGLNYSMEKQKRLTNIVLWTLIAHILCIVAKIMMTIVLDKELDKFVFESDKDFHIHVNQKRYSLAGGVYLFLYFFALEFFPLLYVSIALKPSKKSAKKPSITKPLLQEEKETYSRPTSHSTRLTTIEIPETKKGFPNPAERKRTEKSIGKRSEMSSLDSHMTLTQDDHFTLSSHKDELLNMSSKGK